ncbi:MAG TPA: paraquat-inducible protein A [Lacipirellulaceae bacterium]|nr:paraquat-inducible protein A [Lacipirellulaceae bacterium]
MALPASITDPSEPGRPARGAPGFGVLTCPSCNEQFTVTPTQRGRFLCPHCHAPLPSFTAPRPSLWRSNANAATLALVSELVLLVALFLPFMSIVKLGQTETYSLVGGIRQLWEQGEAALAAIIGAFSLVFPLAKNALLVVASTTLVPLSPRARHTLHALTGKTAKYSMLDVFVVAVIVVVVKLGETTDVAVGAGLFLFCLAIALSMAASACVNLGDSHEQ